LNFQAAQLVIPARKVIGIPKICSLNSRFSRCGTSSSNTLEAFIMKLRSLFTTVAIGTAILLGGPAHAQGPDPCSTYACMAGISGDGGTGGPACTAGYTAFFSIQVWDPYYDAGSTASLRRGFLMGCPGANVATNEAILEGIIDLWMWVP
jgi:hypothetical protein